MMTVNEVSKITGVSIRTLHYYDQIGLLHATQVTKTGYRLYDDTALERLQRFCSITSSCCNSNSLSKWHGTFLVFITIILNYISMVTYYETRF